MSDWIGGCPHCGHELADHDREYGCEVGSAYTDDGIQTDEGCDCPLTIASLHR